MLEYAKTYTVESVTAGHPDKICDQISDAILDACLRQDSQSRVAIESFGAHGLLVIGGEVTTDAKVDVKNIAKDVYKDVGYDDAINIITNVVAQSPDIAQGVDTGGAGDQGIMYGYATDETEEFLPKGVVLAHKLVKGLERLRVSGAVPWLGPDGKSQVTMEGGKTKAILIACQHAEDVSLKEIRQTITDKLIQPFIGDVSHTEILVNPTGKFVRGGFAADTGLTGRKIMVDTYGGLIPHGGGCFSGKDPTKVDRSAAYMARFAAKNIVAAGHAKRCLISVSYAIGRAEPLMVEAINEKGEDLASFVKELFDFRPLAIIERLNLRRPIYRQTASYGHFGREGFPWEEIVLQFPKKRFLRGYI
ncbi:MAG: methionine adenosyltransferase [Candidatus Ryanbacteria bacterium RIFCSPHIGHO2_02_FULL_45_43]|uniref:Methionine adenosyltransferase n=1 Tax=Candidatus Ryanbacteria bacterium RIFCSPHIGHO2_01_45_13 TaxID=1802112 RepID=A0A1G2G0C8_9BACT|nr:MAG: methionine adenosyltransferase [Candidatus Ryanbacteria bacterium RIFCSPHIGHO2_01_FULL_44_130]OGZ43784.1 MAG: methionine adenosyltransferase [Candidatus Ryanbacteria bacterium RIFCSPHIGHO2_01_45_13]OGZ47726.1 MAG: methionine adenosyltransferase [Candidatus Ryanbacteria bacterium RIFCSPHIGHO2_02_FULL_45_43]OGZ49622.1 MAG: methionine adenosyltransferase [Candidatus Ryanbacteria bacterium RIFCSPHIGHO2_12_FULL_44_20]OGZ51304.1 MAG: methionine adenosyltransferase [Candidatus Ryanbacteria bac